MNILSYLFPQKIAEYSSEFNGKISVMEFMGQRYIDVGGLMQSGTIPKKLFARGIKNLNFKRHSTHIKRILLLGLAGGSIVPVLRKNFPEAHITAIDIDPQMIEIGRKYFALDTVPQLTIVTGDVFDDNTQFTKDNDLVIVDVYLGYTVPEGVDSHKFLKK